MVRIATFERVAGLAATALLVGVLAACGDDASSGGAEPLPSDSATGSDSPSETATSSVSPAVLANTYVSTEVTGHELVADSQIRLTFEDDNLSVNAGCNTMFAPYELTDESLMWTSDPASTMMGCSDELMAQDQWLAELFTTGVAVAADGATLTLTSDDVTIVMTRAPDADLQGVFGKTWSAVATMFDGATSRIRRWSAPHAWLSARTAWADWTPAATRVAPPSPRTTPRSPSDIPRSRGGDVRSPNAPSSNGCSRWWTAAATTSSSTGRC